MREDCVLPTSEEREYSEWLRRIEKKAIIPLKWIVLGVSLFFWLWTTNFALPGTGVFLIFLLCGMFNVAQTYFFYGNRITPEQVRPFSYASYFLDIGFVTTLIYFDTAFYAGRHVQSDFYILYFLILLRGFALFRRPSGVMLTSIFISGLFIAVLWLNESSFDFVRQRAFALKFTLIWMVGVLSWFIVDMINNQYQEILKIRERLLRSEQFASLGQLAAGVAHEINNPMAIISAYAEYLLKNSSPDDNRREDYETIRKEAQRCGRIVKQLLDLANPSARQIIECDIAALNEEMLSFIFHDRKRGQIAIEKDIEPGLPPVMGDPGQIKQGLMNIYINARQAMEGSEECRIGVSIHRSKDRADCIVLRITDSGPGLAPEDIPLVFDPFYTRKKGGTGLGLSITRRIIEAHSGSIGIANCPPHGAAVTIVLPVHGV